MMMQNTRLALILAALPAFLLTSNAHARQCVTMPVFDSSGGAFTAEDISGGAVTTGATGTRSFNMLKLSFDLVDANDGIDELEITITESDSTTGTFRSYPYCEADASTWTCGPLKISWDPSVEGKSFSMPIPWMYEAVKVTVTPNGEGAGDTLTITGRGCW